jgi:uncharacterized protein (TIGR03118 family)
VLEDRTVPSGYQQTNLVGYQSGLGHFTDSNLNGWGMTSLPDGSFCVSNAFTTGLATFYDRSGHVLPQTISVPAEADESAFLSAALKQNISTTYGHPTGVVYNPTNDFKITNPETGVRAPATLIFDTIDGTICGWNPVVDPTHAIVIRDTWAEYQAGVVTSAGYAVKPAVYTGLEIGQDSQGNNVLYAADFLNNQLEVIGGDFNDIGKPISTAGRGVLSDPYSWVWSVQAVNNNLYVTFADLLNPTGGGGGAVDVFDTDGNFHYQLAANGPGTGPLQNPWGITQAPANFGEYSNDLLVGNVAGKGNINVYDPNTHAYLGQLKQADGTAIAIQGLWDLEFGDGTPHGGKTNWLYFDAGPNHPGDYTDGTFGVIRAAGDQGDSDGGDPVRESAASARAVQLTLTSTLTVTSVKDSGAGSLRAEIAAAVNGDTIVFSPKLDGKTIKLTSGELDLTKNLTIQGPGAGLLTISGNSPMLFNPDTTTTSRVFEVAQNATVTLSGLTITDGDGVASGSAFGQDSGDFTGGGVLNHGALTLSGCTVSGNYAYHEGGGIFSDGTLTVRGCAVSDNYDDWSGGIYNAGTATLISSTVSNNQAWYVDGAYQPHGVGGGIYNNGTLTLSGSTVSGNLAGDQGSGIYNDTSGTVTVEKASSIAQDAYNLGVLYLDSTSAIGILVGNPAIPI